MGVDVSVVIPVYNMEKYIEDCLKSVFNQSYKNIEVIIINDGSTDKSTDIIERYRSIYNNIIYIEQSNYGLSIARNNALRYVRGEYVLFLDSDDYLEEDCIELLYNKAKEEDCDMVIMGHRRVYNDNLKHIDEYCIYDIDENKVYSGKYVANMILSNEVKGYCCDKLIRVENLKKSNLYFEPNKYIEDLYPIFKQVHVCDKITFVNKSLYNYRQVENSLSHKTTKKLIYDYAHAYEKVLDYIEGKECFSSYSILKFKYEAFRTLIGMINQYHNKSYKTYEEYKYTGFEIYEPKIKELYECKDIKSISKVDLVLWRLKVYNLFMPELMKFKKCIESIRLKRGFY